MRLPRILASILLASAVSAGTETVAWAGHQGSPEEGAAVEESAAGHGEGHHADISQINWLRWKKGENPPFIAVIVNFLALAAIIFFAGRKTVAVFLKDRRDRVMAEIDESARQKKEAEARHAEYADKLAHMDREEKAIREELLSAAARERDKLVADAGARAQKMREEAARLAEQEMDEAMLRLKRETADKAIDKARDAILGRLGPGEQRTLVDDYLKQLESRGKAS